jgi:hypothetical protein
MTDLNQVIPPSFPFVLFEAFDINDRGEIVGFAVDPNTDEGHAFLAIPCDEEHANRKGCTDEGTVASPGESRERPKVSLPENVRKMLYKQLGFGRFTLPLTKTAVTSAPSISLSPTSLIFSTQAIGTTSAAKTVTLKNTGTAILTITSMAITGTNAGDFAQTHSCASSLATGASCKISVKFKPTASGTRTAALSISDNASGSPQKVSLSGLGTTAKLSPTSLSFGSTGLGTTSLPKTVTLTNVGKTALTITGIVISGTNASDFRQTHTCGSSLAAGANCSISVKFTPAVLGTRTATLSISDNAAGSPQKVALFGIGVNGGTLTGYCLAPDFTTYSHCRIGSDSIDCPSGQPAIKPDTTLCQGFGAGVL